MHVLSRMRFFEQLRSRAKADERPPDNAIEDRSKHAPSPDNFLSGSRSVLSRSLGTPQISVHRKKLNIDHAKTSEVSDFQFGNRRSAI